MMCTQLLVFEQATRQLGLAERAYIRLTKSCQNGQVRRYCDKIHIISRIVISVYSIINALLTIKPGPHFLFLLSLQSIKISEIKMDDENRVS